jgi:type II secretory pathway component PulK
MSKLPNRRRGERGSAYIVVLMALVVLTIVGLSLVMVTQTEVQLGSNERTINRTFYAAESGLRFAAARYAATRAYKSFTYIQNELPLGLGGQRIADEVQVTVFAPIAKAPCDWCPVNANEKQYFDVNNLVTSTSRRMGWSGSGMPSSDPNAKVLSQAQISVMVRLANSEDPQIDILSDPTISQVKP